MPASGTLATRNETLTAIRGVRVGHAHDARRRSGTTVVLFDRPSMSFADHRGGWPGSYDTAGAGLGKTFVEYHALFLTGGDAFGYEGAVGIRRYLATHPTSGGISWQVPPVMGTNIYDLDFARVRGVDYARLGYRACQSAGRGPVAQGNVGAGAGATVGPFFESPDLRGTKGGLGSAASRAGPWTVGAIAVSNCVGNVFDPFRGRTIGGARRPAGQGFVEMDEVLGEYLTRSQTRTGTTIGILGTDAPLDHEQLARLVELVHDGIALSVRPAHMSTDGDTILGFTTRPRGARRLDYRAFDVLHHVGVREMARAVVNGVYAAKSLGGVQGLADSRAVRRAASLGS